MLGLCCLHVCRRAVHCRAGRPRLMALYVVMLTRPAFAALGKAERVRILKAVFLGQGDAVPRELKLGDGSSVLRQDWWQWVHRSSLMGTLRRLQPTQFADVVLCLMSCAGLQVVVGEPSHVVVTTGLAYVALLPQGVDAPPVGCATFVEVGGCSNLYNPAWTGYTSLSRCVQCSRLRDSFRGLLLPFVSSPFCLRLQWSWRRQTPRVRSRCTNTPPWRCLWCSGPQGQLWATCTTPATWPCCRGWVCWASTSETLWTT